MATTRAEMLPDSASRGALVGRPRMRRDVQLFVDERDGCVLRHSRSGREFQLGRWERLVVQLLDGTRRPADVCRELRSAHSVRCDPRLVERFIAQLESAQLLADGGGDDSRPVAFERRGMLYLIRLICPDPWARRAIAHVRWIDHRIVASVAIVLAATAAVVVATSLNEIAALATSAWTPRALALALVLGVAAGLAHESAHALTAVSYGAHLASAGCGIYWFRPCLFCEIRGLESLPRAKRLAVSGAGLTSDLLLASICAVVWRALPAGTAATTMLVTAALLAIRIVVNLNPLMKLDGYYLLADAIGARDLRESAFRAAGDWLRARMAMQPAAQSLWPALRSAEGVYALLASAYVIALAIAIAVTLKDWIRANVRDPNIVLAMLIVFGVASLADRTLWGSRQRAR